MLQGCLKNYESTSNRSSTRPVFEKVSHPNENLTTDPGRRDESHPRHRPSGFTRAFAHAGIDALVTWGTGLVQYPTAVSCLESRRGGGLQGRNPENDDDRSRAVTSWMRPCFVSSVKKSFFFVSFLCLSSLPRPDRARDDDDHDPRAIRERGAKKIREARFLRFNLDARDASHQRTRFIETHRIAMLCGARARGVTRRRVRRASSSEDLRVPSTIDSISGDEIIRSRFLMFNTCRNKLQLTRRRLRRRLRRASRLRAQIGRAHV